MVTVLGSKRNTRSRPYFFSAYICMMMEGIDTLTAVTAIFLTSGNSVQRLQLGEASVQAHRHRTDSGDRLHAHIAAGAVPQGEKGRRPRRNEVRGA